MHKILSKELLEDKYVNQLLSPKEIAIATGYSYTHICLVMRRFGIPLRPNYKNMTGVKSGKLTAVKFSHIDKKGARWICKCECGKEKIVSTAVLRSQKIKSCGCAWRTTHEGISASHFLNVRNHAISRDITFAITIKQMWDIFVFQSKKCALSGMDLKLDAYKHSKNTASLDRIDSVKGYLVDNVQWVHKDINCMKSNLDQELFIQYCKAIASHKQ